MKSESSIATPVPTTRIFAITVAYDGTHYCGWQVQSGQKTIQGELELAVARLIKTNRDETPFRILGSGRTDSGVHALGQVARCVMTNWPADGKSLMKAINSGLPDDIIVLSVREAIEWFHPIADAVAKQYRYQLQIGGGHDPFGHRTWVHVSTPVDVDLLQLAAEKFIGTHDFAAFQASGGRRDSTIRTISKSLWRPAVRDDGPGPIGTGSSSDRVSGAHWMYEVEGDGFLYNMVRNLVGTMLEVAFGRHRPEWIDDVFASKDRNCAGPTAPPHGLFLCRVDYPDRLFIPRS